MLAIKKKQDLDNQSDAEKRRLAHGNQLQKDVASILVETETPRGKTGKGY